MTGAVGCDTSKLCAFRFSGRANNARNTFTFKGISVALPHEIEIGVPATLLTMLIESMPETVRLCIVEIRSLGIAAIRFAAADRNATESDVELALVRLTDGNEP